MPITKSAKKAWRQNIRRKRQNLWRKNRLKTTIKNYKKLLRAGQKEEAKKQLNAVYKIADKTAKTGIIKKGKASRLKSRLSRLLTK